MSGRVTAGRLAGDRASERARPTPRPVVQPGGQLGVVLVAQDRSFGTGQPVSPFNQSLPIGRPAGWQDRVARHRFLLETVGELHACMCIFIFHLFKKKMTKYFSAGEWFRLCRAGGLLH